MSAGDYLAQLKALLPPGLAWGAEPGGNLEAVLAAMAEELARFEERAEVLLAEGDPRGAVELLTDWERIAGLPDDCNQANGELSERRQSVATRLAEVGDVSEPGWIARAAALGHQITLATHDPAVCGQLQCGDPLNPYTSNFELEITVPVVLTHPAECGNLQCGDELGAYNTQRLECELDRVRQAHTVLHFNYT